MQPTAFGWELFKADNLGEDPIYITVTKTEGGKTTKVAERQRYEVDKNQAADGTGNQIAQIVALDINASEGGASVSPAQVLGNADKAQRPVYEVQVFDAKLQGSEIYKATVYPVYAQLIDEAGNQVGSKVLLGIRTANTEEADAPKNLGVGETYYYGEGAQPQAFALQRTEGDTGFDNVFDAQNGAFIVTYKETAADSITGTVTYVDDATGEVVRVDTVSGIDAAGGKDVEIRKSFTAEVEEGGKAVTKYFRALSGLAGQVKTLTPANANITVRVMPVEGMGDNAYQVTVKYLDKATGELLWSDSVDVKGYGYQYTLPNTFSMSQREGVELYQLSEVKGGEPAEVTSENGSVNGTSVVLGANLVDADFVMEDGKRTVEALYDAQNANGRVTFTLWEVDGSTGNRLSADPVTLTVTPEQSATYTPQNKEIDGTVYVPWSGNAQPITYSWSDLARGVDLMQNIYYVPEGYMPEQGYDVTVQYMNIADGSILSSRTVAIDPEANDFTQIDVEQNFAQDGENYVLLDGQNTSISHAFFSPMRTYTLYYRNVNDQINANTVITRTQIIETPRYVTVPGPTVNQAPAAQAPAGITAAPVAVPAGAAAAPAAPAAGAAPAVDAGVAAGDGAAVINDGDNPLANPDGVDTATERTIEDNENPLASGNVGPDWGLIAGIGIGVLAAIGLAAFLLVRRRNTADKNNA